MMSGIARAAALALGPLVLGLAAAAPLAAQEGMPPNYTVNVVREHAAGMIFVNGIPVHPFAYDPSEDGAPLTDAASVGLWLIDGANTIAVESKATQDGGYTEVVILESFDVPSLLEQRIDGEGRVEVSVDVAGAPHWVWLDAETVSGDGAEVLAAVAALHEAIGRGDIAAFEAAHAAKEVDFTGIFGPMPEDMRAEMHKFLALPLKPLAADLTATPYLDGKVWVVSDGSGLDPIQLYDDAEPDTRLTTGRFWSRIDGVFQVIR
jgi:hypothetical protein